MPVGVAYGRGPTLTGIYRGTGSVVVSNLRSIAFLTQLVEYLSCKQKVSGSTPLEGYDGTRFGFGTP